MARPNTDVEAVRAQLLDHVEVLIASRGGASVTLAELATVAGMSPANIYRFFENKEALYEAVAERWFAPKIRIMEEVVASDLPIRDKLYQFFARRFTLMLNNYDADPMLFKSYLVLGKEHQDIVLGYLDLGDHYLAMLISEAEGEGYFPGLSIDAAVSLVNLMVKPFIDAEAIVELRYSVSTAKLAIIIDTILTGMRSAAAFAERPAHDLHLIHDAA